MTMAYGAVSDDHLPFIAQGVETLHVIPQPFPRVWHTMEDDGAHLDGGVVRDWARIVAGFVLEWLDMMEVWDGDTVTGDN
jgi:glutaminyl-peptide cyclotransferase